MRTFGTDALECLASIVKEGGFERAATRLCITQSAVSQRLRALEAQVGTVRDPVLEFLKMGANMTMPRSLTG